MLSIPVILKCLLNFFLTSNYKSALQVRSLLLITEHIILTFKAMDSHDLQICDQFSAELFKLESGPRPVPLLCNTSSLINSTQSNRLNSSFCSTVWDTCQNVPISNSPFVPPSPEVRAEVPTDFTPSKLTDFWKMKSFFCDEFGGSTATCFDGEPVSLENTDQTTVQFPQGLCLEKIGNGAYLNMAAHPDGSNRAFFSEQSGKIWLANIPEQDSGETLGLEDESSPFVDLTGEVYYDGSSFGLMGVAFHPNFAQNGRFFASFNCDKVKTPGCSGRCSCNAEVDCDPLQLSSSGTSHPCQFHKVIAEFSANETAPETSMVISKFSN